MYKYKIFYMQELIRLSICTSCPVVPPSAFLLSILLLNEKSLHQISKLEYRISRSKAVVIFKSKIQIMVS